MTATHIVCRESHGGKEYYQGRRPLDGVEGGFQDGWTPERTKAIRLRPEVAEYLATVDLRQSGATLAVELA
jgi:hypothetical protein